MKLIRLSRPDRALETAETLLGKGMNPPSVIKSSAMLLLAFNVWRSTGGQLTAQSLDTVNDGSCQGPDLAGKGQSLLELVKACARGEVVEDGGDGGDLALDG